MQIAVNPKHSLLKKIDHQPNSATSELPLISEDSIPEVSQTGTTLSSNVTFSSAPPTETAETVSTQT